MLFAYATMRVLVFLIFLSIYVTAALAISCYECDSLTHPKCGQCFFGEDVPQVDCDDVELPTNMMRPAATGCYTKFYEGIEGQHYFIRRMCYYGDLDLAYRSCETAPPDPLVPYLDFLGCTVCDDDLCNAGKRTRSSTSFLFAVTLFILLIWR